MSRKTLTAAAIAGIMLALTACGSVGRDAAAITHKTETQRLKITDAAAETVENGSEGETTSENDTVVTATAETTTATTTKITESESVTTTTEAVTEAPEKDNDEDKIYRAELYEEYTNGYSWLDFSDAYMIDNSGKYMQAYDTPVYNDDVISAVNSGNSEKAEISGYHNFTFDDFESVASNEVLNDCFDRLDEIISSSNCTVGFAYENMATGAYLGYNQFRNFRTCSTIKAPFVMSLLAHGVETSDTVYRNWEWSGDYDSVCAKSDWGSKWTAGELMELAVQRSDNTAYMCLCKNYGVWDFNSDQNELGAGFYLGDGWIFTDCTPDDMLKDYKEIYKFGEESREGRWLISLMSDTDLNIQIGQALGAKYTVAHKYGSDAMDMAFSDCAIVYANSPYVLTIYTVQNPETPRACEIFKELANCIDDINSLIK